MRISNLIFLFTSLCALASEPLSFDSALSTILERSTGIETQKERKEEVEAKNWSSKYSLLPTLSLIGSDTITHEMGASENTDKRFYGLSANLNLFHFGTDISQMMAAHHENAVQDYLVEDRILKAEEDGVKTLLSTLKARLYVKSLEANFKTRVNALTIGRERFRRGLFAAEEVDKLLIDHANVEAQLRDAEIELLSAKAALLTLLGADEVITEWPWKQSMENALAQFAPLLEVTLALRPDWKAAEEQAEAAHARKRQLLGMSLPSLDLSVNYGRAEYRVPEATSRSGTEWQGILTLTIPLFDKFSSFGNYRASVHSARAAEIEKERIRRMALSEWNATKEAFLISFKSAQTREKTLETTQKLYEVNAARFHRGLIHANELMIDQDRLLLAELNAIKGWSEAHLQLMKACHTLGHRVKTCLN